MLEKNPEGYRNGDEVRRHLLPGSPEPRSDLLLHGAKLYERWGHLFDSVKTGEPVSDASLDPRLVSGERGFARAMADVGRRSAALTCNQLDLSGTKTLLDIGGGPGIYAVEFAQRWPELEVTILDRQEALEIALNNAEKASLTDRIHLRPGDALADDLGGPYDAIFISNVIHIYSAAENQHLIHRCAETLAPGGQLILKDFFLDEDRKNPPGGAVFAVNMLVNTEGGDCYAAAEAQSWLEHAGLQFSEMKDIAEKSRLVMARQED